jgi:hypothetical protein
MSRLAGDSWGFFFLRRSTSERVWLSAASGGARLQFVRAGPWHTSEYRRGWYADLS